LFWKKAKPGSEPLPAPDILDTRDSENQREAFRYAFEEKERISVRFLGETVWVLDISAGGISFFNKGFSKYDADRIHLDLDIPNYRGSTAFSALVRILFISRDQVCHCIFENCTIEQYEMLHKYVLELQKKKLRNRPHDPAH